MELKVRQYNTEITDTRGHIQKKRTQSIRCVRTMEGEIFMAWWWSFCYGCITGNMCSLQQKAARHHKGPRGGVLDSWCCVQKRCHDKDLHKPRMPITPRMPHLVPRSAVGPLIMCFSQHGVARMPRCWKCSAGAYLHKQMTRQQLVETAQDSL